MRKKYFKILITGSDSYNNKRKLNQTLFNILKTYDSQCQIYIATYGSQFGAEYLVKRFCQQNNVKYGQFSQLHKPQTDCSVLSQRFYNKKYKNSLFYINIGLSYKWFDMCLVFSNIYETTTNRLLQLNQKTKKNKKDILIIKQ